MTWFLLHLWRIFLLDTGFWVDSSSLSAFENIMSFLIGYYSFWREINCHLNCFSSIGKVSFFEMSLFWNVTFWKKCFQDYVFSFKKFNHDVICLVDFFGFSLFGVWSSWIYRFMSFVSFGKFSPIISLSTFLAPLSFSFLSRIPNTQMVDLLLQSH